MTQTYTIKNKDDLFNFIRIANMKYDDTINAELMNDIDLTLEPPFLNKYNPIGMHCHSPFRGIFEGNGHSISGLYSSSLFGYNCGEIRNLTVDGLVFSNAAIVKVNAGIIQNCVNKATVDPYMDLPSGVASVNFTERGKLINCRNLGELKINCFRYFPTLLKPSQICGYESKSSSLYTYNMEYMWYPDSKNHEDGKFIIADNNTLIGLALKTAVFSDADGVLPRVKDLLLQDNDIHHINAFGQNYMHLLCKNAEYSRDKRLKKYLQDLILFLAENTSIDFSLKDDFGFTPDMPFKNKFGKVLPGFSSIVRLITSIAKDQIRARKEQENNEEIDCFGF